MGKVRTQLGFVVKVCVRLWSSDRDLSLVGSAEQQPPPPLTSDDGNISNIRNVVFEQTQDDG
jgi:hypothetical protein